MYATQTSDIDYGPRKKSSQVIPRWRKDHFIIPGLDKFDSEDAIFEGKLYASSLYLLTVTKRNKLETSKDAL